MLNKVLKVVGYVALAATVALEVVINAPAFAGFLAGLLVLAVVNEMV